MTYVCGKAGAGVEKVVLPIPPVSIMNEVGAGAGVLRSSTPDTASNIGSYCIITGAGFLSSSAPDTASNYWIK